MKSLFIYQTSLAILCLLLNSCNTDELITPREVASINHLSSSDTTATNSYPFMTPFDLSIKNSKTPARNSKTETWTQFGPYTVAGTLTKIYSNYKLSLINKPPYASGVYFCDIWKLEKQVTLPAGSLMMFQGASKEGYSNYTTQTPGVLVIQNSNTYTFVTYSIVPVYNVLGQYIYNGTLPRDLTGGTFTYSYLRDI